MGIIDTMIDVLTMGADIDVECTDSGTEFTAPSEKDATCPDCNSGEIEAAAGV